MNRRTFISCLGAAALTAPVVTPIRGRASTQGAPGKAKPAARAFISRLQPAVAGGGFELPDHWVWRSPRYLATWARKRIGLATSRSVRGLWKRLDAPLLEPRPGEWDSIAIPTKYPQATRVSWQLTASGQTAMKGEAPLLWSRFRGKLEHIDGEWRPSCRQLLARAC